MRFANERIAQLVDYIQHPHISRERRSANDPYYYGMDEATWRQEQNDLHTDIQDRNIPNSEIHNELVHNWNFKPAEASDIIEYSSKRNYDGSYKNPTSRHVRWGVPQAGTSEEVARLALEGSGLKATNFNKGNHYATDLEVMIDGVNKLVDVQNRYTYPGAREISTIPVLTNLSNGVGQRVFNEASGDDSIYSIVNEVMRRSPDHTLDKLMHSQRNADKGRIPQNQVKDYVIGGAFDVNKIKNKATRRSQGTYNPSVPSNMVVEDLNALRQTLGSMSKKDYLSKNVQGDILSAQDEPGKLKLRIPHNIVEELSKPTSRTLTSDVREVLNHFAL